MERFIKQIKDPKKTRKEIALIYRENLMKNWGSYQWGSINSEIILRWGYSSLRYIKKLAWNTNPRRIIK